MNSYLSSNVDVTYIYPAESNLSAGVYDEIELESLDCDYSIKKPHISDISHDSIQIVDDTQLMLNNAPTSVLEVQGIHSFVKFRQHSQHSYLVIHLKPLQRYFKLSFLLSDVQSNKKSIEVSNNRSVITIDSSVAQIPVLTTSETTWQRICLDLPGILENAYGIPRNRYASCSEVTVFGTCRVAKIFFQADDYADARLPPALRVVDVISQKK